MPYARNQLATPSLTLSRAGHLNVLKAFLITGFLISVLCIKIDAKPATDMDQVIGRLVLILSKEYTVSCQTPDQPTLWVNARLDRVAYPDGKTTDATIRWQTERIPADSGLVLKLHPPFNPETTQKDWSNWHDTDKRQFVVLVPMEDGRFVGLHGFYGADFPKKTIDQMIALSKE